MKRPIVTHIRHLTRGLSLVELLLALAIGAALMFPLVQMQATAAASAAIVRSRLEAQREADFALERIAARVRATAPAALAPNATDASSGAWFGATTFERVNEQLIERTNGVSHVLADSVTAFRIVPLDSVGARPLVRISLTLAHARAAGSALAAGLANGGATTTAAATVRMGSAL